MSPTRRRGSAAATLVLAAAAVGAYMQAHSSFSNLQIALGTEPFTG